MTSFEPEILISSADRIATVTLNRPEQMNAVNGVLHGKLAKVFRALAEDESVDIVIFTGAGAAFCAGGDLDWLQSLQEKNAFNYLIEEAKQIVLSLLELPKPVICRMNGDAIGLGATLALCCDVVIAADTARWGDPHVRVGLVAGDGAAVILPHVVGYLRAKELLMTGDILTAAQAERFGIVNHVVSAAELDAKVQTLAQKLRRGATQAIRWTKVAANRGLRQFATDHMDALMAYEALSAQTRDHAEAIAAFREKRRPVFQGR